MSAGISRFVWNICDAAGLITRAVDAVCVLRFEIAYLRRDHAANDRGHEPAGNAEFNTLTRQRKLAYRRLVATNGAILFHPYTLSAYFDTDFNRGFIFAPSFRRSASDDIRQVVEQNL